MTRDVRHDPPRRRRAGADPEIDEALFLAELRFAVEGARTAAEERLAALNPGWRPAVSDAGATGARRP